MFPTNLRTGSGSGNNVMDHDLLLSQAVTLSALNALAKQAVYDCSVLTIHHLTAELYYYMDVHKVKENEIDSINDIISKPEQDELRAELMNVVMEYHILHPNGIASRFTPLIDYISRGKTITNNDPLLVEIVQNSSQYNNVLTLGLPSSKLIEKIMDFPIPETSDLLDTIDQDIKVGIYEDDEVRCMCDYCTMFFTGLEATQHIQREGLNPIQEILIIHYSF